MLGQLCDYVDNRCEISAKTMKVVEYAISQKTAYVLTNKTEVREECSFLWTTLHCMLQS